MTAGTCHMRDAVERLRHASSASLSRDPELEAVLQELKQLLGGSTLTPRPLSDDDLSAVEAAAAPYALAFIFEIRRLDDLVRRRHSRHRRGHR